MHEETARTLVNARPFGDRHAIVDAAFGVTFASNPTPATIREVLALHAKLRDDYPRRRETKGRLIGFEAAEFEAEDLQPKLEVSETTLSGFTFDSLRPDGTVERSISLSDKNLSITRGDYESWQKTWDNTRELFSLFLPVLLERLNISAFHLEYHDRFIWEGERPGFRADMIFRRESRFIVSNIFYVRDLWHSFHGYFDYLDKPYDHQLLNIVEVQILPSENVGLDASLGLVAEIRLKHRTMHGVESPGGRYKQIKQADEAFGTDDGTGLLDGYMHEMHDKDKWLLARLINDEMCSKIGLDRPE